MSQKAGKGHSALWGGRFGEKTAALMQAFSQSVSYDKRLYRQDIKGSIAHARMLQKIGVLSARELSQIQKGLKDIELKIDEDLFNWSEEFEDLHMNIESALTHVVPAGAKLHTGRSRNDQVATDMRMWVMEEIDVDKSAIRNLQKTLVSLAEKYEEVILPGYTHLQRAQPVTFAHHCLAYVEMLERDYTRMSDARKRMNVLPLGSGAIAGSTIQLDRKLVAKELGFEEVSQNSLDSVSDRDFILEYVFVASQIMVHLSRLAEDLIIWSSAEFGFVRIGDTYTTGSSLMPQKKNPDAAELIRGKTGRVVGDLMSLLTLIKGLPMTYNRDLQEDKEQLFDAADTLSICLEVMAGMLKVTRVREDKCLIAASDANLLATDVADELVQQGVPFRQAHEIVGKGVALAEIRSCGLNELTAEDWQALDPRVKSDLTDIFNLKRALTKRKTVGSPGLSQVKSQLKRWRKVLAKD
ncbi:MAG: argininosuccinate lyase [Verrucomicrobiota bacterium]